MKQNITQQELTDRVGIAIGTVKRFEKLCSRKGDTSSAKSGVFFAPGLSRHSPLATADGRKKLIKLSPPNGNIALGKNRTIFKKGHI